MKVITLNTWGGRAGKEKLLNFFEKYAVETDVFCLQEIWSAPYEHLEGHAAGGRPLENLEIMTYGLQEISATLSDFTPLFRPHHGDNYGLLILVKNSLTILEEEEVFVHREKGYKPEGDVGNHARNVQYVSLETSHGPVLVLNFHGLWNGKGKGDSEDRITQSEKIISFLERQTEPVVFCGDFNLNPETKSLQMIENTGLRNLIKEHGITSTRTSLYTKEEKFADYVLIGPGIQVTNFEVLPDEVSDHAPLRIEFEIK